MKKRLLYIFLLMLFLPEAHSQMIPSGIVNAFKDGKAKALSSYFNDNLEMLVLEKTYITSKNQATRIIEDFFKKYPPVSFKVDYEGTKQDSKYGSGILSSSNGNFRVNLYFMEGRKEKIIYYLTIEKI